MQKLKQKLIEFMRGRYGSDELNRALIILWMILAVINMFVTSKIIYLITLVIAVFAFYRMLSRNVIKRRRENERFCGFFRLRKNKFRDRKTHVYRKCPNCRAVLRLPRAKGKHHVVCPRCKHRFEVKG